MPNAAHAVYYAEIVRDKSTLRPLILASTEILRDAYDESTEPREMLSQAEEKIFAILDKRGGGEVASDRRHPARGHGPHRRPHEARARGRRHRDRLHRLRHTDRRPARLGADHPGRPAQHGQNGAWR